MPLYKNISGVPEDLEGGRVVGPNEVVDLSEEALESEFNQRKVSEGRFLEIPSEKGESGASGTGDRDQLLDRAEELDIKGRDRMNTNQLSSAIAKAEQKKGDES